MELGVKTIVGGVALFVLGGLSVYLLTRPPAAVSPAITTQATQTVVTSATHPTAEQTASTTTSESFYEAAEARREQQIADKAEADRLAKLLSIKERSVECKFWKQQQKTSSAAAKIGEKIIQYCTLASSSSVSNDSAVAVTAGKNTATE